MGQRSARDGGTASLSSSRHPWWMAALRARTEGVREMASGNEAGMASRLSRGGARSIRGAGRCPHAGIRVAATGSAMAAAPDYGPTCQ